MNLNYVFKLSLILFILAYTIPVGLASAVPTPIQEVVAQHPPVDKKIKKQQKKRFKNKFKKAKKNKKGLSNKNNMRYVNPFIFIIIGLALALIIMLVIGIAFQIPPLWITAVVLLSILLIFLIFTFIIMKLLF